MEPHIRNTISHLPNPTPTPILRKSHGGEGEQDMGGWVR
ncbi:predicted protein [Plenodomus lingam JN3]|uniref:Predicted protein n=1 Tax=Leptosphaeria maculans (strain JN3 / isolate v23.1.3 / race Av1-4-5-6-7-8) TaxID=985895 RepID=E4ZIQ3_LEPMJ|nr:predicted protein [Plenodomus lingam JN3]CBX91074.1 predicted protein [Plenodomus lingam JN3]